VLSRQLTVGLPMNGHADKGDVTSTRETIPSLSLTFAQVLWILHELGFAHNASNSTFFHYVKSLRRLGIPFENRGTSGPRHRERYKYESIMELAVALSLRVYATLPDAIPDVLREHRARLHDIYRRAILEERTGLGAPARIGGSLELEVNGVFLEFQLKFAKGRLVRAGAPIALGPVEAMERLALGEPTDRSRLPLNLSQLALRLLDAAARAPRAGQLRAPNRPRRLIGHGAL
jgi:hypothetical protein